MEENKNNLVEGSSRPVAEFFMNTAVTKTHLPTLKKSHE